VFEPFARVLDYSINVKKDYFHNICVFIISNIQKNDKITPFVNIKITCDDFDKIPWKLSSRMQKYLHWWRYFSSTKTFYLQTLPFSHRMPFFASPFLL